MQIKRTGELKGMLDPVQNRVCNLEGQTKQNFILTKDGTDGDIRS